MLEEESIERQIISGVDKVYVNQPDFILCEISEAKESTDEEISAIREYLYTKDMEFYPEGSLASESLPALYCNEKFLLGKVSCPRELAPHGLLLEKFITYTFDEIRRAKELEDWCYNADREGVLGYITEIGGLKVFISIEEKEWLDRKNLPLRQFSAFVIFGEKDIEIRTRQKSKTLERRSRTYW